MKKNTFKIKNHFANLSKLALIVLFISVFSEVNAQSSSKTTTGTAPAAVQPTDAAAPQSTLQAAPAPDASEAVVIELKTAQPEPGTMNATTVVPAAPVAKPSAVQPEVAPAAQQSQEKKQAGKKQPK